MIENRTVHHAASEAADHRRIAIARRAIHHLEIGQPHEAELAVESLAKARALERRRIGDELIRITELALHIQGKRSEALDLLVAEFVLTTFRQTVWMALGQRELDLLSNDGREHVAFRRINSGHQKRKRVMWTVCLVLFIVVAAEYVGCRIEESTVR